MRIRTVMFAGLVGAAAAYLLDPVAGPARRTRLRKLIRGFTQRRTIREDKHGPLPPNLIQPEVDEVVEIPEESTTVTAVVPSDDTPMDGTSPPTPMEATPMDDAAVAGRIRSEVQGRPGLHTGNLVVNVVRGVAFLRGELKDRRQIDEVVDLTGAVPGVRKVQNFIHLHDSETLSRQMTPPLGDAWSA